MAREGSYRADVKLGGDPNHALGHAHIYNGTSKIASVDAYGNVLEGKLKGASLEFVRKHMSEIAEGINKFYYLK